MAETHPDVPGNDAPAGPATAAERPTRSAAAAATRVLLAGASGTTVNPLDRANYAPATSRGYGSAMGRGLELAITLLVCCGIGLLIDHLAGTSPLFTIIFSVIGFAGIGVKLKLGYDLEMAKEEEGAIWNRGRAS